MSSTQPADPFETLRPQHLFGHGEWWTPLPKALHKLEIEQFVHLIALAAAATYPGDRDALRKWVPMTAIISAFKAVLEENYAGNGPMLEVYRLNGYIWGMRRALIERRVVTPDVEYRISATCAQALLEYEPIARMVRKATDDRVQPPPS